MTRYTATGMTVIAACLASACAGADHASSIQRTDSAGIEIVSHTGPDTPLDWTFSVAFTLGGKETDEESFYAVGSTMIGVDAARRIYVLDHSGNRVIVFDADGRHVRTMGGEGAGPGEMRFPITLSVAPDGTVHVFDIAKRGFVRFGPDGNVLDEERVTITPGNGAARFVGSGLVVPIRDLDVEHGTDRRELILVTGADTAAFATVERPAGGSITLTSCGMQMMGVGPVFEPDLRWSGFGGTVAVTSATEYDVTVYRDGTPVQVLRRSIAPVPATPEAAERRVGTGMKVVAPGGGVRTCDAAEVVEQRGVAEAIPVIGELTEGPNGTLWVRRAAEPGNPQPIDVYDREGTYLGSLPADSPFPAAVLGDQLIAVERDDMDVERLVIYRVTEGTS